MQVERGKRLSGGAWRLAGLAVFAGLAMLPPRAVASDGPHVSETVIEADDCFLGRENLENVRKAVGLLRGEVARDPNNYEAWWRIAKFNNFLARRSGGSEKMKQIEAGIAAGKRAVALGPKRVEGHFWLGASYGMKAEEGSWLDALRLIDTVRSEMEIATKLDSDYEEASAPRTLARLYYEAPFFKGGDKRQSVQLLEDCLRRFPNNSMTMLYLADSYRAVGRREEARRLLERMLSLCPDPQYGPELADNQAQARALLNKEYRAGK